MSRVEEWEAFKRGEGLTRGTVEPRGQLAIFEARPDPGANRVGASHSGDPDTSRQAARANAPRSGSQRRRVLDAVAAAGARGVTAEEVAAATGMRSGASGNSAAKRLSELKADGWVAAVPGLHRRTAQGSKAQVYRTTIDG